MKIKGRSTFRFYEQVRPKDDVEERVEEREVRSLTTRCFLGRAHQRARLAAQNRGTLHFHSNPAPLLVSRVVPIGGYVRVVRTRVDVFSTSQRPAK